MRITQSEINYREITLDSRILFLFINKLRTMRLIVKKFNFNVSTLI